MAIVACAAPACAGGMRCLSGAGLSSFRSATPGWDEVPEEMKLLLADGRILAGAEAIVMMMRTVWWLSLLGWLLWLPGLRRFTRYAYRWAARRRYRLGGCSLPIRRSILRHSHTAFLDLP